MSLVSGRLQQELGNQSGSRDAHARSTTGGSSSSSQNQKHKTAAPRNADHRKNGTLAKGYDQGRYRLGTHNEGEEEDDSTEPEARHLARRRSARKGMGGNGEGVSPGELDSVFCLLTRITFNSRSVRLVASPPLSPGEGFLAKDLGRGPYLSQSLGNSHVAHARQAPPTPQQGHRQTFSQASGQFTNTHTQGKRMDSNVSWIPFDPSAIENSELKSPVGSFTAGLSVRGGANKASAEDILKGSTLCALYLVSGLPKVSLEPPSSELRLLIGDLGQDVKSWSLADKDAIKGVENLEDALPCRFRPEGLGRTFGGQVKLDQSSTCFILTCY